MTAEERKHDERRYEEIDTTMRLEWMARHRAMADVEWERCERAGAERSGPSEVGPSDG